MENATKGDSWFPAREQIAERAHALWLEEGKPEARDLHHWLRAEQQLREEHARDSARKESPGMSKRADRRDADIESDKRVDGLAARSRDPRSPDQENL